MRPMRCSRRDGFHGRSTSISVPRVWRFSPSQAASVATTSLMVRSLTAFLISSRSTLFHSPSMNSARFPGAGVDRDRFAWQTRGQAFADPFHRVVILAEDDAAHFQPAPFAQVEQDGVEFRVARIPLEAVDDRLKMQALLVDDVQFPVAEIQLELFVVDRAAFQQLPRRRQPGGHARAYALTQQPLQEAGGLLPLAECSR